MHFIQGIPKPPSEIRLVHGERDAQEALKAKIDTWAEAKVHKTKVSLAAQSPANSKH